MSTTGRLGLIGDDLIKRSRLTAAVAGVEVIAVSPDGANGDVDALMVDLNRDIGVRIAAIATWRAAHPDLTIVGFCSHGEAEVRRQAMAAGADRVVTNGGLAAEGRRLVTPRTGEPK